MNDTVTGLGDSSLAELADVLVNGPARENGLDRVARAGRRLLGTLGWWLRLRLVNVVAMSPLVGRGLRRAFLRVLAYRVTGATLESSSILRSRTLTIGAGSFVNHRCFFASGDITLGRNVFVSTGVSFMTGDHRLGPRDKRAGEDYEEPIVVEDGCWIGANVVVLHGVRIAAGCVVGAGAVVTGDTEPDGVYVGIPARRVRDLD